MTRVSAVKERWFAGFMVVLSAALLVQSFRYPAESAQFPRFLMMLQVLFSLILLVQAFRGAATETRSGAGDPADTLATLYAPFKVFVATSLYVVVIGYLGYFVATALFLCLAMLWFGSRRPVVVVAVAGGFLLIVYALFVAFMGVRLPEGILF